MEVNKIVFFNDSDVDILTGNCCTDECEKEIKNLIEKYDKKLAALKCTNNLILAYILDESVGLTQNHGQPLDQVKTVLEDFRTYVARMLSALYLGRGVVPRSLVAVHIKLIAAADTTEVNGGKFLKNAFLVRGSLKNDIDDYSLKCEHRQLLAVKRNSNRPEHEYVEIVKRLYDNRDLADAYNRDDMFTAENLSLLHVYGQHDVLFNAVDFISWEKTQRRMDEYKNNLQKQYNRGQ